MIIALFFTFNSLLIIFIIIIISLTQKMIAINWKKNNERERIDHLNVTSIDQSVQNILVCLLATFCFPPPPTFISYPVHLVDEGEYRSINRSSQVRVLTTRSCPNWNRSTNIYSFDCNIVRSLLLLSFSHFVRYSRQPNDLAKRNDQPVYVCVCVEDNQCR